jgi:hypothetical protein
MCMKTIDLINYKMPDAMMFMNQKGLAEIQSNLVKMCQIDKI